MTITQSRSLSVQQ